MEDPLHLFGVERDPLDLAAFVLVVEGHRLTGGCAHTEEGMLHSDLFHED